MTVSKALVFDIKRFALHDGSGLRTTVFFKGCPLRCRWCQNPEGLSPKKGIIYFEKKCIHCQRCRIAAKPGQLEYKNDRPYFLQNIFDNFDNLINACPSGAISYDCQEYDLDELMNKITADRVFFRDDGGVTFSGGEPLLQGEFLLEILKRCKAEGIHTAIETTMYGASELIQKILPYLDLIYIDLKIFDEESHQRLTGVSVAGIKAQIRTILQSEHKEKVIIRTPLIPGITASDENIRSIAQFLKELDGQVHYELLNYNPLAAAKYELYDKQYGMKADLKPFNDQQMQHFYQLVKQAGIKNLIIE